MAEWEDREMEFWRRGADVAFFESRLASQVTMVFPRVGLLDRAEVVAAVGEDDVPWTTVRISDPRIIHLGDEVTCLSYRVDAARPGHQVSAYATSVYERSAGGWRLAVHHQTPAEPGVQN